MPRDEVEGEIHRLVGYLGEPEEGESPYRVWEDLQALMQNKAGMVRFREELQEALEEIQSIKKRAAAVKAPGDRLFNPGWHVAMDLQFMVIACEATIRGALTREESRGGHTRGDFIETNEADWGGRNVIQRNEGGKMQTLIEPISAMPAELKKILDSKAEEIATKGAS